MNFLRVHDAGSVALLIFASAICLHAKQSRGDDWNQWLGPSRDSVWHETGILEHFPEGGPKIEWRTPISGGYAGPAVSRNRVVVHDFVRSSGDPTPIADKASELEGTERVLCLDATTGEEHWRVEYSTSYKLSHPSGPRATPVIDGEYVYTLGAAGKLTCIGMEAGQVVWSHDLVSKYGMETPPFYGFAGHPLIHEDKLICLVGGEGSVAVAFDKRTGEEIWTALSASEPGYCPPMLVDHAGARQLLIWHAESLNCLDPGNGSTHWSVSINVDFGMSIVPPVKSGEFIYADGYSDKNVLLKLADQVTSQPEVLWRNQGIGVVHSPVIADGEHIYAIDKRGVLRCIELQTGKRLWETLDATTHERPRGNATAFIVRNADRYFIFNDQGELIVARLTPEGFEEIDRATVLEPTDAGNRTPVIWSHPAFANRCMYARNDKEIICVSLAKQSEEQ